MKNILLILMMGLFLISLVSAGLIGPFQQGQNIRLIQTCDDCTFNNITTVLFPNGTVAIENVQMEKDGTSYNYTLNSSFTTELGTYIVNGVGDLGGINTVWAYDFELTTTGKQSNLPIPIFLLIASITLFMTGLILKNPAFGFFSGILFLVVGMYIMIYGFGNIADLYTQAFALVTLGFGFIVTVLAGFSWLDEYDEGN